VSIHNLVNPHSGQRMQVAVRAKNIHTQWHLA